MCGATPTTWASGCIASTFGFYRDWGLGAAAELLQLRHPQSLQGLSLIRSSGQIPVPIFYECRQTVGLRSEVPLGRSC